MMASPLQCKLLGIATTRGLLATMMIFFRATFQAIRRAPARTALLAPAIIFLLALSADAGEAPEHTSIVFKSEACLPGPSIRLG
jgi:hypothetical protein